MNELQTKQLGALEIWNEENLKEIKMIFAPNLSDLEFTAFVGMGKATGLNPFLREIWAVKYDKTKPAQIFIGRDGYRKSAQQNPDYEYHRVEAVYSDDFFEYDNGVVSHKYTFAKRGILLGAYCMVKKRNLDREIYTYVQFHEYNKGQSNWNTMKETMIKKVAEAQGLKSALQDQFSGTQSEYEPYDSEGQIIDVKTGEVIHAQSQTKKVLERLKSIQGAKNHGTNPNQASDSHPDDPSIVNSSCSAENSTPPAKKNTSKNNNDPLMATNGNETHSNIDSEDIDTSITQSQLEAIDFLLHEKKFSTDRVSKAFKYFEVTSFKDMSYFQAEEMIEILGKED